MTYIRSVLRGSATSTLFSLSVWAKRVPKPISPQAHAYFDLLAFPAIMGLAAWMWRRNQKAAMLIVVNGLLEGTTAAITHFPPPGPLPLINFRAHVAIGLVGAPLFLAVSSLVPGIPWVDRRVVLLLNAVPLVLNGLSDTRSQH